MNGQGSSGCGTGGNPAGVSGNHVIFPMEAEAFVQELTTFSISDIGSNKYDTHQTNAKKILNKYGACVYTYMYI